MPPANLGELLLQTLYPQMTQVESSVAHEWLLAEGGNFDRIVFQFPLGEGAKLDSSFDEPTRRLAAKVSVRRADIVAERGHSVTIVEVKERINATAIGQLILYRELYLAQFPITVEVRLLAIGRTLQNDSIPAFVNQNVEWKTYPR